MKFCVRCSCTPPAPRNRETGVDCDVAVFTVMVVGGMNKGTVEVE